MRRRTIAVLALAAATAATPPADAVEFGFGATGAITVYADLGACATLTFSRATVGAGTFSAAGAVTGPGTAAAPVRGATPFVLNGARSWYGCLPDAYAGATTGHAAYVLSGTTADGDFVAVLSCTVRLGVVTCR